MSEQQKSEVHAAGEPDGRKRLLLRAAAAVLLAAVVLGVVVVIRGFWIPGLWVTRELNVEKVQHGVQETLSDEVNGFGSPNVKDVSCNNGVNPVVEKGRMFDCTVTIDGDKRELTVTIEDDSGTYEVGRPK